MLINHANYVTVELLRSLAVNFILKSKRHQQTVAGLLNRSSMGSPTVMVKDWQYLGISCGITAVLFLKLRH